LLHDLATRLDDLYDLDSQRNAIRVGRATGALPPDAASPAPVGGAADH
jgi:hypothetical protein